MTNQMTHQEKILQVRDLTVSFKTANGKVQAVRDISFDLHRGETLAIVGESGSGKSVTSKAILGISAVNAMHESGEILYRDKDLLQIDEEEFHELRGSQISMVFQDPLSALNPIMKTGKQITEAIMLNNQTDRDAAKKNLDELYTAIDQNLHEDAKARGLSLSEIDDLLAKFKNIQKRQIELEIKYAKAREHASEARRLASSMISDISRHYEKNVATHLKKMSDEMEKAKDEYMVSEEMIQTLEQIRKQFQEDHHYSNLATALEEVSEQLSLKIEEPKQNFFYIAHDQLYGDKEGIQHDAAEEKAFREFINPFRAHLADALKHAEAKASAERAKAREVIQGEMPVLEARPLDPKASKAAIQRMAEAVEKAINHLDTRKDSALYTFRKTLENNLKRYTEGIHKNKREERRYHKTKAKHDRLVGKGKNPGWKVVPLDLIDLEWAQDKFTETSRRMLSRLELLDQRAERNDYEEKASVLINHVTRLAERAAHIVTPNMAKDHAINLMREVGIPQPELRFKQYPFELSGGMRQRIVIAIALCANPDVLICDEPTTALDVTIQAQILELINQLKKERELSIIFITHDLGVVANMADRIAVMYAGKIVEIGEVDEVFYEPAHPYTWALLSSMPDLETKEKLTAIPGTPPNMLMPPVGDAFADRNRYAMKIDFEKQPPMFKITDTHYAATWLLAPGAPDVEPPPIVTERIERMKAREAANELR